MFPTIIEFGPFAVRSYGLMVAFGLFAALHYVLVRSRSKNIPENKIMDLVLYAIVAGLVGARLVYVLTNYSYYSNHMAEVFKIWEGGLVYYGGFIAGLAAVMIYIKLEPKLKFWELGDILAPALSLGHVFGRIGCLLAGCCYGKPSGLPWAVKFTDQGALAPVGVCLHPTQVYEALGNLVIFIALDRFNGKDHKNGQTVLAYMFLYGIMRYILEYFRGDDRGAMMLMFSQGQLVSLLLIAAAIMLYYFKFRESKAAER